MLASRLSCLLHGGPSPLMAKPVVGYGAGGEREPRPGRPSSRIGPQMAGTPAECMETPGDPGTGDGRQPGSSSGDRARNVAV
jgi:hypothetical protein